MDKNYKSILESSITGEKYFNNEDLRINRKIGILLSNKELDEYLKFKENSSDITELPLKSFNSKKIYYSKCYELLNSQKEYLEYIKESIDDKNHTIISDNMDNILISRIASELEGTLRIEGVNTTRKKILDIVVNKSIKDNNDQIIYNMYKGMEFILDRPLFNKDNLLKLYNILSYNSLKDIDKPKGYYRNDMVEIGGHDGCPVDMIDECMDSLFSYVNDNLKSRSFNLPFIAHYYILYIHPYMDFNGRTARMVSLWINNLIKTMNVLPSYISEAINDDKNNYYKAIDYSRNSNNDLTYFIIYLYKLANEYYIVYKNISEIKNELAKVGESLNNSEIHYLKRIIINRKRGWFNYKGFIEFANLSITKQGALKILNHFLEMNLLITKTNSKKEKVFLFNEEYLYYELKY